MFADTATIQSTLEGLRGLPAPVLSWRVEEGLDATDDPAVWVWAIVQPEAIDPESMTRLKAIARHVVRDATGLWAYVLVRGVDEIEATA